MSFFKKKAKDLPRIQTDKFEPVLRSSICTGEQVLCLKDRATGAMHELMLISSFSDLEEVCSANGIEPETVRKVY